MPSTRSLTVDDQVDLTLDFWELVDPHHFFLRRNKKHHLDGISFFLNSFCGAKPASKMEAEEIGHVFQRLRALSEDVQRLVGL